MLRKLNKLSIFVILISLITSCAGIPANKVKLENYPTVTNKDSENINLNSTLQNNKNSQCEVRKKFTERWGSFLTCYIGVFPSFFTATIIPYYCQNIYELDASLVATIPESHLQSLPLTIKPSIKEAKEGDYYLNENNELTKLLKTYYLEDKVHEVWSLIWMLNPFSWDEATPERAKSETQSRMSQALARQVIHDANQFEECKKTQNQPNKITNKN